LRCIRNIIVVRYDDVSRAGGGRRASGRQHRERGRADNINYARVRVLNFSRKPHKSVSRYVVVVVMKLYVTAINEACRFAIVLSLNVCVCTHMRATCAARAKYDVELF